MEAYSLAVVREMELRVRNLNKISTIYVGGGTPTVLPPFFLMKILARLSKFCSSDTEFTIEANPATVNNELLEKIRFYGVNRISFGVQSFNDTMLKKIGRLHTADEAREVVKMARKTGFENINIDLIYGLPGEELNDLKHDVSEAMNIETEHISIYGLQVEDGTVFSKLAEQGKLYLPGEEVAESMYDYLTTELPNHGYERYEISNFARKGFESRHNLGYWQDVPYIGIGAAAHSYIEGKRLNNCCDIARYIGAIERGELPLEETEPATRENQLAEFCFLGLRTIAGIDKVKFAARFGCDIRSIYGKQIEKLIAQKLVYETDNALALTDLGMKYGNVAFAEFIL